VRKIARLSLFIFILAIIAVLSGIVSFNAGFIRGPIETAVYEATGLPLSIGDHIVMRLGPRPGITSGGIVFGDPAGSPLLTVDSLHARVGLFALLMKMTRARNAGCFNGISVSMKVPAFGTVSGDPVRSVDRNSSCYRVFFHRIFDRHVLRYPTNLGHSLKERDNRLTRIY